MGKSMKKLSLLLVVVAGILLSSCKREVSPELEVTVVDSLNTPVRSAKVKLSVDGANFGIVNPKAIDSTQTDGFGKAYFDLDNTVLVDVSLFNGQKIVDSTSILLETKKLKKDDKNVFEIKMVFN
jgi:hypothetical protein